MCNGDSKDQLSSIYLEYPQISILISLDQQWGHRHHVSWIKVARIVLAINLRLKEMRFKRVETGCLWHKYAIRRKRAIRKISKSIKLLQTKAFSGHLKHPLLINLEIRSLKLMIYKFTIWSIIGLKIKIWILDHKNSTNLIRIWTKSAIQNKIKI